MKKAKLNNAGFFAYSREEGTAAYNLDGQIPESVKKTRVKKLYAVQKKVSREILSDFVGKTLDVIADGIADDGEGFVGRAYFSAPEIDGKVYFTADGEVMQGEKYSVLIKKRGDYDLYGEAVK